MLGNSLSGNSFFTSVIYYYVNFERTGLGERPPAIFCYAFLLDTEEKRR